MPIQNGKYVNPGWVDGQEPAIDATELNAMSDTIAATEQQATTTAQGLANFISGTYNPFVQNVYTKDQVYTKTQVLSGSTSQLFGQAQDAIPDVIFQTINTMINLNCEIHEFSYAGTGTSGGIVTADKPIIILNMVSIKESDGTFTPAMNSTFSSDNESSTFMIANSLTTEYTEGTGIGDTYNGTKLYGKKSSDGKTFEWYASRGTGQYSFNEAGCTYYGFYIC